jgi:hypothetical protein
LPDKIINHIKKLMKGKSYDDPLFHSGQSGGALAKRTAQHIFQHAMQKA